MTAMSTTNRYRIDLTDIRGVGPAIRDHLSAVGIDSVAALHLLSTRGGRTWRQLADRGVGADTLAHLQAVGSAVDGTNRASVQAGHLTADFAREAPNTMAVSIEADDDATTGRETADLTEFEAPTEPPDEEELERALNRIREVYDDDARGMDAWMDFSSDIADHLDGTDHDDLATDFYQPVVQHAIVRYPLSASQVRDYDEAIEAAHLHALVDFAASL